ncbi:sigma-54 interaction domain-containing protein [uncultured Flavonifractor sp.]|uniref:sigma-54 interaction domain-containing protein n=1 Tax=uncultured Flavonifractor sp. TaxID=1193534 RepID=UPI003412709D
MLALLEQVKRVAALDATVLLLGETGVGKEKIAKYIYKNSARKEERFLAINCGAISPTLMESELFGYERGAFTGASREGKMGLFEVADKGTVFLDEIGELPLDMQVRLLRVLQEQTIQRVVAATNRNLEEMVRQKTFRQDLFYRLNVVPIRIPPLRERQADIPAFLDHFLAQFNQKYNTRKEFAGDAVRAMLAYEWPGNVRELKMWWSGRSFSAAGS